MQLPFKVLDAPALSNDYYLNLLDWSCHNVLAVGLGSSVHLHNASTGEVKCLWEEDDEDGPEYVSSVAWAPDGKHLAVGFSESHVEIWNVSPVKKVRGTFSLAYPTFQQGPAAAKLELQKYCSVLASQDMNDKTLGC